MYVEPVLLASKVCAQSYRLISTNLTDEARGLICLSIHHSGEGVFVLLPCFDTLMAIEYRSVEIWRPRPVIDDLLEGLQLQAVVAPRLLVFGALRGNDKHCANILCDFGVNAVQFQKVIHEKLRNIFSQIRIHQVEPEIL